MSNIYLIGFMGSGKTTLGKQLAELMKLDFIDLDLLIEEYESMTVNQIFSSKGEEHFRMIESEMLKSLSKSNAIIATGGGTPCFHNNMQWLNENGKTVYLKVAPEILLKRLLPQVNQRPLLRNKSEAQLLEFIQKKLTEREKFYTTAHLIIDANNISAPDLHKALVKSGL